LGKLASRKKQRANSTESPFFPELGTVSKHGPEDRQGQGPLSETARVVTTENGDQGVRRREAGRLKTALSGGAADDELRRKRFLKTRNCLDEDDDDPD
jgi:hypothetical protein